MQKGYESSGSDLSIKHLLRPICYIKINCTDGSNNYEGNAMACGKHSSVVCSNLYYIVILVKNEWMKNTHLVRRVPVLSYSIGANSCLTILTATVIKR